jgi:hypothetical protein
VAAVGVVFRCKRFHHEPDKADRNERDDQSDQPKGVDIAQKPRPEVDTLCTGKFFEIVTLAKISDKYLI